MNAAPEQPSTFACPHCGRKYRWRAEMAGKRAKCACGETITTPISKPDDSYDLVTDDDVDRTLTQTKARAVQQTSDPVAVAAALPDAVPPVFARPPMRDAQADAEVNKVAIHRLLILMLLVILLVVGIAITRRTKQINAPKPLGQDAMIEQLIKDHDGTEATSWMKSLPTRMVMGMTRDQAEDRIREMYQLGAVRVLAFDPVITKQLVIVLPTDPAARARLFDYVSRWDLETKRTPENDVGQKYLMLRLP